MSSLQMQMSSTFEPSSIQFSPLHKNKFGGKVIYLNSGSKNKKMYLQLPYMRAPFGLSSFTDEGTKKTSYSLNLSFDDTPEINDIKTKMQALDEMVLETVANNSESWLGKKFNINVLREALYKPLVHPGKGDYAPTMKLKVMTDSKTGDFIPEAYNSNHERVSFDNITSGQKVMAIIEIPSIWFIDNKFGVSAKVSQVLMAPTNKLPSFAFQGVEPPQAVTSDGDAEEEEDFDQ